MNAPHTPNPMGVYRKLQEARLQINAQAIKKGGRNEFAKYNYMELGDFLIPAQTIFANLSLCGVVSFTAELATLTITDFDTGANILITSPMSSAALKGCHEVQNLGAVQTYLRRYLWVAALEIVEHDAIDSAEPTDGKKTTKPPVKAALEGVVVNPEDLAYLRELASELVHIVEVENKVSSAFDSLDSAMLDADQKLALWDILAPNSKTRSALKREGEARRAAAKTPVTLAEGM
jgi:hypothetical protein